MRIRIFLFLHVVNYAEMRKGFTYLIPDVYKYTPIHSFLHHLLAVFPRSNIETLFSEYG